MEVSEQLASAWNELVRLSSPRLHDFRDAMPGGRISAVFPEPSSVVEIGQNLFVTISYGQRAAEDTAAISLLLVTTDRYFSGNARARTVSLKGLRLMGIPVPCSAQEFLDGLRSKHENPSMLTSDTTEMTLVYGGTVKLSFSAGSEIVEEPSRTRLDSIEYFYTSPYSGRLAPTLSVA